MSVRGYAAWKPKGEAAYWVTRVQEVLQAYREEWPLSNRQLFYRLVAEHGYDKTEKAYNKLTQMVSRGRRAGLLDWAPSATAAWAVAVQRGLLRGRRRLLRPR
jgi:hypothetical protein